MEFVDKKRDEVLKKIEKTGAFPNELNIGKNIYDTFNYKDKTCINNNSSLDIELKMIRYFDETFNITENYYYLIGKNPKHPRNFGDIKTYNPNAIKQLENYLNNKINNLKIHHDYYLKNVQNLSQEIFVYEEYAHKWFNETKNNIFKNLVEVFNC